MGERFENYENNNYNKFKSKKKSIELLLLEGKFQEEKKRKKSIRKKI